jgi:hypothetical protein
MTVPVGTAPLAGDFVVRVDANKLFGRHLAVLGNTGSGKSCSVAQIIRRSIEEVGQGIVGFRAIILDLNDEYGSSFDDLGPAVNVRRFSVVPSEKNQEQLRVPSWLWNYREWLSFTEASAKSQAPQLRRALHLLKTMLVSGFPPEVVSLVTGRRVVRLYASGGVEAKSNSDSLSLLQNALIACESLRATDDGGVSASAEEVGDQLKSVLAERRGVGDYVWKYGARQLDHAECSALLPLFDGLIAHAGVPELIGDGSSVDTPRPFDAMTLVELLPVLAASSGPEVVGWVAPLVERLRILLADERLDALSGFDPEETLQGWLSDYLADGDGNQISILDLSLVPAGLLHLVAAVIVRLVLEALERHRRTGMPVLPVLLVAEEAHALVRRHVGGGGEDDQAVAASRLCREAFERVAREGRKFGLSLVVSSQRPSELSETVLSQCNTFLVHRIVNDHDQRLVRRLIPDSLGAMTDELPALPAQVGLLVGWATEVPALLRVDDLAQRYRPHSADPDFTLAWKGEGSSVSWDDIANEWVAGRGRSDAVADPASESQAVGDSPHEAE